jgi:hypothetical protein
MAIERRSLFQILGAGLASSQAGIGQAAVTYMPRALTPAEYRVVDHLVDVILPADETSPGAHEAGVARYIDIVLLYGDKATLASWQSGVKAVDAAAREAHARSFIEITGEQRTGIVRMMAANETNPVTQLERFFETVKRLAVEAFYLSTTGKQSLGYKGDAAILRFSGCTDHEHKG